MSEGPTIHPEILFTRGRLPTPPLTLRQLVVRAAIIAAITIIGAMFVLSLFHGYFSPSPGAHDPYYGS
jgi:hypothetical protein